jgi:regulator of nucleoside diphosphate kinase
MTITMNDRQRLLDLMERPSVKTKMPLLIDRLSTRLGAAKLLSPDEIKKSVITMNSRVRLKDLRSGSEAEITITYPRDANPRDRRVSILSEIGLALLGKRENDVVSWRTPKGEGSFSIERVTYQPEAAGDYDL